MGHFIEADFPTRQDPGEPQKPKTKRVINPEKLAEAVKTIQEEFKKIQTGQSEMVAYAITPGSFGFPAGNRLSMLVSNPTMENIKAFTEICAQDFNNTVSDYFNVLLTTTIEEVPND